MSHKRTLTYPRKNWHGHENIFKVWLSQSIFQQFDVLNDIVFYVKAHHGRTKTCPWKQLDKQPWCSFHSPSMDNLVPQIFWYCIKTHHRKTQTCTRKQLVTTLGYTRGLALTLHFYSNFIFTYILVCQSSLWNDRVMAKKMN